MRWLSLLLLTGCSVGAWTCAPEIEAESSLSRSGITKDFDVEVMVSCGVRFSLDRGVTTSGADKRSPASIPCAAVSRSDDE